MHVPRRVPCSDAHARAHRLRAARRYRTWLGAPLDAASRVLPDDGLAPAAADAAMRGFARRVLAAAPRPSCVVLDQNLQSQVEPSENAATGDALAAELRAGGYELKIIRKLGFPPWMLRGLT